MSLNISQSEQQQLAMLDLISQIFSRYLLAVLLMLGTVGLVLNTLIFTRRVFRQNSCVNYFLASTIANYFVVFFILPSRILSDGFKIDPGQYNLFYCKIRFYVYFTAKSLSSWFIVLACFDRRMSSSTQVQRRAFAQLHVSRWMIFITTAIGLLFYGHVLIFYEIDEKHRCDARAGAYRLFNDAVYLIGYSFTPPLLMLIFGICTIIGTRRLRRIAPRSVRRTALLNNQDHALMLMLILQVVLITITAVPHALQKLYSTLTLYNSKSELSKATENVFVVVVRAISFVNHSCTFYILTLSGRTFRQELFKLMKQFVGISTQERIQTQTQLRIATLT